MCSIHTHTKLHLYQTYYTRITHKTQISHTYITNTLHTHHTHHKYHTHITHYIYITHTTQALRDEGVKAGKRIFALPGYGASNFFMPLTYHGDREVNQHGPTVPPTASAATTTAAKA